MLWQMLNLNKLFRYLPGINSRCLLTAYSRLNRTAYLSPLGLRYIRFGQSSLQSITNKLVVSHCQPSVLSETDSLSTQVEVIGWVRSVRRHKNVIFFDLSDGSTPFNLQVVSTHCIDADCLTIGSAVRVKGCLQQQTRPTTKQESHVELLAERVQHLSSSDSSAQNIVIGSVGANTPAPSLGLLRSSSGLGLRHRLPEFGAILRLRARIKQLVHSVLQDMDYLEVDTPILTTTDCEGGGDSLCVTSTSTGRPDQNEKIVRLTGSAQLHLEALVLGLTKVYTLNPVFRDEVSHTRHHLSEFYMLELESVHLTTVDQLCNEIESVVRNIFVRYNQLMSTSESSRSTNAKDVQMDLSLAHSLLYRDDSRKTDSLSNSLEMLSSTDSISLKSPFTRITFDEAVSYLNRSSDVPIPVRDFTKDEERQLVREIGENQPLFITHFPTVLKPFYCASLDGYHAEAVDLLVPGIGELVGGSVRENNPTVLTARLNEKGTGVSDIEWYLNLRTLQGSAPHGGFGMGFERLLQLLLKVPNIRDVIPFPRLIDRILF